MISVNFGFLIGEKMHAKYLAQSKIHSKLDSNRNIKKKTISNHQKLIQRKSLKANSVVITEWLIIYWFYLPHLFFTFPLTTKNEIQIECFQNIDNNRSMIQMDSILCYRQWISFYVPSFKNETTKWQLYETIRDEYVKVMNSSPQWYGQESQLCTWVLSAEQWLSPGLRNLRVLQIYQSNCNLVGK